MPTFRRRKRGSDRVLLLLPGWATDARIFSRLDLPYDYLEPEGFTPLPSPEELREAVDRYAGGHALVLGFSLGGFLAAAFAQRYPDRVQKLVLLGIRQQYPPAELAGVRTALDRDPAAFLDYFYRRSLAGRDPASDAAVAWFNNNLREPYLAQSANPAIPTGLACLAAQRLTSAALAALPEVHLIHGADDAIAPLAEVSALADGTSARLHVLPAAGHLLPLHPALPAILDAVLAPRHLRHSPPAPAAAMPACRQLASNFARAASTYTKHSAAQARVAEALLALAPAEATSILEPGCGTGLFTALLRARYPGARILSFDFAHPLVACARDAVTGNCTCAVADALHPPCTGPFGLIAANAVFNWLDSPAALIARYRALLASTGTLLFSAFGPRTFRELGGALHAASGRDPALTAAGFPDGEHWRLALAERDPSPTVEVLEWREEFPSLLALLRRIKYTGTRGRGLAGMTMTKNLLQLTEEHYRERQGGIFATWQAYLCRSRA